MAKSADVKNWFRWGLAAGGVLGICVAVAWKGYLWFLARERGWSYWVGTEDALIIFLWGFVGTVGGGIVGAVVGADIRRRLGVVESVSETNWFRRGLKAGWVFGGIEGIFIGGISNTLLILEVAMGIVVIVAIGGLIGGGAAGAIVGWVVRKAAKEGKKVFEKKYLDIAVCAGGGAFGVIILLGIFALWIFVNAEWPM